MLYDNIFKKYNKIEWKKELTLVIPSSINDTCIQSFKAKNSNVHMCEKHLHINPQFISRKGMFHIRNKGSGYDFQSLDPTSIDLRGMKFEQKNVSLNHFFGSLPSLKTIIGLNDALKDTETVTSMANMFSGCRSLEQIDITANFELLSQDFCYMFYECEKLQKINIPNIQQNNPNGNFDVSCIIDSAAALTNVNLWTFLKNNQDKLPEKLQNLI